MCYSLMEMPWYSTKLHKILLLTMQMGQENKTRVLHKKEVDRAKEDIVGERNIQNSSLIV